MPPIDAPTIKSGIKPCFSRTFNTPICARPLAPPPERTTGFFHI